MEISVSLQFHLQSIAYPWTVFGLIFLTFCTHKNKNNKYSNWRENLEKRNNANQLLIDLWKGIDGSMQNSNTTKLYDDLTFTWKNPNRLKLKLKWLKFTRNFNYLACSHNQYHVNIVGRNGSCKGFFSCTIRWFGVSCLYRQRCWYDIWWPTVFSKMLFFGSVLLLHFQS